jgi:hypothetical protein
MSKSTMEEVVKELEGIENFPTRNPSKKGDNTRANVIGGEGVDRDIQALVLGLVRDYAKSDLQPSRFNRQKRFDRLHLLLKKLMKERDPTYRYTTIQINKSVETEWHRDKNNIGDSYCLSLGKFSGGGLDIRDDKGKIRTLITKNRLVKYDGDEEHRTAPFKGERYAIIFFKRK